MNKKSKPYALTVIALLTIWGGFMLLPEFQERKIETLNFLGIIAMVICSMNWMGRNLFPSADWEKPALSKHFNSILIALVISNLVACVTLALAMMQQEVNAISALLGLLPLGVLVWQGISLPNDGFMLHKYKKEWEKARTLVGHHTKI